MRITRTTILALAVTLVTALALCSCNLDATDGIYSEIAASTESTNVTLKAYLGQYSSEYYYLTDDSVCKIDGNGNTSVLFSSTRTAIIRAASLSSDGSILVLKQNMDVNGTPKGSALYYNKLSGSSYANPVPIEGSFNALLVNGLFYDSSYIYHYEDDTKKQIDTDGKIGVARYLENGEYAFFRVTDENSNYKYYVIKADGTKVFDGITSKIDSDIYAGFQPLASGTDFILLNYSEKEAKSNLYLLANGDTEITDTVYTKLKSSIQDPKSTQSASMLYTKDDKTYVVFKCSSFFDKVRVSDEESEREASPISTGFAANLRTAEVTNILPAAGTANVFIAGTVSSMLYKLDMNDPDSTPEHIK